MNVHLHEEIISIIKELTPEEREEFLETSKKLKTDSDDKEYVKLFNEYLKQEKEDEIDIEKLKSPGFKSFPSTNKNLKKKLLQFLTDNYQREQLQADSLEKIKLKILTGKALMSRKLYLQAEQEILPAFRMAKTVYLEKKKINDHYEIFAGYLTELFFLMMEIHQNYVHNSFRESEEEFHKEIISPIVSFASAHYYREREIMPGGVNNDDWEQYCYNEILRIYYRQKEEYDKLVQLEEQSNIRRSRFLGRLKIEDEQLPTVEALPACLWQFEKMYASLITRDFWVFESEFRKITEQTMRPGEVFKLNVYFTIFCYRELYRLAVIYAANCGETSLLKELSQLTKQKLFLFEEREFKNVGLHFHVNEALLKFMTGDFKGYIDILLEAVIVEKLKQFPQYYFPLRILLLFSYRMGDIRYDSSLWDKIEKEIKNKFLKENEEVFYANLIPFLKEGYWGNRRTIAKEKFEKLEKTANSLDHFHQIILSAIRKHVKEFFEKLN